MIILWLLAWVIFGFCILSYCAITDNDIVRNNTIIQMLFVVICLPAIILVLVLYAIFDKDGTNK